MPRRCIMKCTPVPGVEFHVFPSLERKPERFKAWVQAIGGKLETAEDYQYYRNQRICDRHFSEICKNRNNRVGALGVPTLYLNESGMGETDEISNRDAHSCSAQHLLDLDQPTTSGIRNGAVLHAFPNPSSESDKFHTWVVNAGLAGEDDDYIFRNRRICRLHFEEIYYYPKNRLSKLAVPTLHLSGPLHLFPNPNGPREVLEKFNIWKSVLPALLQERGNNYIYNNIRFCNKHFLEEYCLPSHRLTRNAVPTLRLGKQGSKDHCTTQPTDVEVSNDTTCVEAIGTQGPKDHCTTVPTVAENSNDSFTDVENYDELPEQTEISDVSMEAAPSAPMQFCICCLQRGVPLVNLLTCSHADFLNILMVPQIQAEDRVVCYTCHQMLKKIKKFKRQVQESFQLLSESSIEKSLKKYSNYKRHLTIHETLNLEISEANENSKTTDNIEKALTPTSSHKDRNFEIPETNENFTTTDNTKKAKRKSSHKNKKTKNKKQALKIINGNQNNEYFDLLSTSLKSLSQSSISDIYTDFQSSNTTEITSRPNDTAVEDIIDKLTDGKEEEEYIILEVGEYQNIEIDASVASPTHKRVSPNIKQLTLSKRSLLRERAMLMSSPSYVSALHRCRSCVIAFTFRDNLNDHVSSKHTAPPDRQSFMKCRVCRQFVRRDAYNIHRSSHYNRYQCLTCGQIFSSYDDAALHDKIQHLRM